MIKHQTCRVNVESTCVAEVGPQGHQEHCRCYEKTGVRVTNHHETTQSVLTVPRRGFKFNPSETSKPS